MAIRHFFGMPKILELLRLFRQSYDGLRCPCEWPDVFTIAVDFENFPCSKSGQCDGTSQDIQNNHNSFKFTKYIMDWLQHEDGKLQCIFSCERIKPKVLL